MKKLLFTVFTFVTIFATAQEKRIGERSTKASVKLEESKLKESPLYVQAKKLEEEYANKVLAEWIKENDASKIYICPICYPDKPSGPLALGLGAIIAVGAINNPDDNTQEEVANIFHSKAEHKNIKQSDKDLELKKYIELLQREIKK
ncbi:hypothetical protein [Cellulophaga fucicola]|uniref:Uncharacterized protein n=1 Tax=Cellulophaga fucicola TaxID=76595 RepID=A0A1K1NN56_9FLAO|nr:hypothetical protein [Cellulophaga fucicola]SFW36922.1 hypothetical protein SAMN05660313_01275 [Cellulophaga fucicola]